MYQLAINEQTLIIEGVLYTRQELLHPAEIDNKNPLYNFLAQWFDGSEYIGVHTSGSTGKPKKLIVRKEQMMQSARLTCEFLNLQPGDTALLCMSLDYIAGKMVVVRALIAGLDLYPVPSCGHPLENTSVLFRFAAMIPLQVYNSLQIPAEKERLANIDTLIIGGGAVDPELEDKLKLFSGHIYSTYGMTETLSHIALRRINGPEASHSYVPFSSVSLSLSPENALIIDAPLVCDEQLVTNDIAMIYPDGKFDIIGRKDNIINSGGIKIQIETVEEILKPLFRAPFAITAQPHPKFGEIVVLLVEPPVDTGSIKEKMTEFLPPYQLPKKIIMVDHLPLTGSGKISRAEVRQIACRK